MRAVMTEQAVMKTKICFTLATRSSLCFWLCGERSDLQGECINYHAPDWRKLRAKVQIN